MANEVVRMMQVRMLIEMRDTMQLKMGTSISCVREFSSSGRDHEDTSAHAVSERSHRRHGEGITAANSLPGENQSLGDLSLFFVVRRRIPCVLL